MNRELMHGEKRRSHWQTWNELRMETGMEPSVRTPGYFNKSEIQHLLTFVRVLKARIVRLEADPILKSTAIGDGNGLARRRQKKVPR